MLYILISLCLLIIGFLLFIDTIKINSSSNDIGSLNLRVNNEVRPILCKVTSKNRVRFYDSGGVPLDPSKDKISVIENCLEAGLTPIPLESELLSGQAYFRNNSK